MAKVSDPASGRGFELWSNQPGLQFYSGNFLDGTSHGKANRIYREGDAIVMEPQIFPDTPNQPAFGSARLARSEEHTSELQSLMRISYAVFCLKKKKTTKYITTFIHSNNIPYN